MENQSVHYTELHLEIIDLLTFHETVLQELALAGKKDPEHDEKMGLFTKIRDLVDRNAQSHFRFMESEKRAEADLMKSRLIADCETCGTKQKVEIVGEDIDEETGLKRDIVVCTVCGDEFVPMRPNNWEDRITWGEMMIDIAKEMSESIPGFQGKLKKHFDPADAENYKLKLRATQEAVTTNRKKYSDALNEAEASLIPIYEDLLQSKVHLMNYNQDPASA